ncbi:hypothetical protein ACN28S_61745 [Cystobacter fuscus]
MSSGRRGAWKLRKGIIPETSRSGGMNRRRKSRSSSAGWSITQVASPVCRASCSTQSPARRAVEETHSHT